MRRLVDAHDDHRWLGRRQRRLEVGEGRQLDLEVAQPGRAVVADARDPHRQADPLEVAEGPQEPSARHPSTNEQHRERSDVAQAPIEEVEAAFARFDASRIRLVGFQGPAEVAAWLRDSDLYVWPAIDEAFGMAFIEAQACGLPVIAGNGGGVASVVAAGRTGLLAALGDAEAFAQAIRTLIADGERRRQMAMEAVAYAKSEHDLPGAAARIDAVLRRAAAEHASMAGRKTVPAIGR